MTSRDALRDLCHRAGVASEDLVISAEGNASVLGADDTFLVKASGCQMATLTDADLVDVRRSVLRELLTGSGSDAEVADAYRSARTDPAARTPSVEAVLHAVLYDETPAQVLLHTHPTPVNALLCSVAARALVDEPLFPDQVVVLGRHQLLVPYADPGVPLALAVRDAVRDFGRRHDRAPRVVYLVNHGMFSLARSTDEALHVTRMAVKVARTLLGAIQAGGPVRLTAQQADRLDRRPDEEYRRRALAGEEQP